MEAGFGLIVSGTGNAETTALIRKVTPFSTPKRQKSFTTPNHSLNSFPFLVLVTTVASTAQSCNLIGRVRLRGTISRES